MQFRKVTRRQLKARVALAGPSGSGKTYTALRLAFGLVGPSGKVAVVDTENRSAEKYVGTEVDGVRWDFDVATPDRFDPVDLAHTLREAAKHYDVIVVDSLTAYWSGIGGMLERVDNAAKRTGRGNSFEAWKIEKPAERELLAALVGTDAHLIVTMRVKSEYVIEENDRGKKVPRKIGLKPEQRDGIEYEFDFVADLDGDHNLIPSKSRCPALDGRVFSRPGADVAQTLRAWLDDGEAGPAPAPQPEPARERPPFDAEKAKAWIATTGVALIDVERDVERIAADWTEADRPAIKAAVERLRGGA